MYFNNPSATKQSINAILQIVIRTQVQSFKTSSTTQCTFQKWPYQWWGVEFNLSDLECSVWRDTQWDAGLSRCAQPSPFMLCTHYIVQDCIYVFHIFSMFQYSTISASIFVHLFYLTFTLSMCLLSCHEWMVCGDLVSATLPTLNQVQALMKTPLLQVTLTPISFLSINWEAQPEKYLYNCT